GIRDDLVTGVQTCALPILKYSCDFQAGSHQCRRVAMAETCCGRSVKGRWAADQSGTTVAAAHASKRQVQSGWSSSVQCKGAACRSEGRRVGKGGRDGRWAW